MFKIKIVEVQNQRKSLPSIHHFCLRAAWTSFYVQELNHAWNMKDEGENK